MSLVAIRLRHTRDGRQPPILRNRVCVDSVLCLRGDRVVREGCGLRPPLAVVPSLGHSVQLMTGSTPGHRSPLRHWMLDLLDHRLQLFLLLLTDRGLHRLPYKIPIHLPFINELLLGTLLMLLKYLLFLFCQEHLLGELRLQALLVVGQLGQLLHSSIL